MDGRTQGMIETTSLFKQNLKLDENVWFGSGEEYSMLLEIEQLTEVMDKLNRIISDPK